MQIGAKESQERKRADEIYDFVVKPALAEFNLVPYRADLDPTPGGISVKLLAELVGARLVVADLTGRNPNVFYELGITHAYAKPLISIAESSAVLPFDAKDERVIELGEYAATGLTYAQGERAKKALIESLRVVLADNYVPPSPLRDVAANRSLDDLAPDNPVAAELAQMRETLLQIDDRISSGPTGWGSDAQEAQVLREFIRERLNKFTEKELLALITDLTSLAHDEWVRSLVSAKFGIRPSSAGSGRVDPDDDPWATTPPPTVRYSDEPPF